MPIGGVPAPAKGVKTPARGFTGSAGGGAALGGGGGGSGGGSSSLISDERVAPAVNPNAVWKDPLNQQLDSERAASFTPGVGITDPARLAAAHLAKQQAVDTYKDTLHPQGFTGDPNALIPKGQTLGGVNQYYNPATGGMFVGNPFRSPLGNVMSGAVAPTPASQQQQLLTAFQRLL